MSLSKEQQEIYVSIWKQAVDTQMHFNEMSFKARQFGLAFVAAALGLGIVLLSKGEQFSMPVKICGGFNIHATVFILFASALALYAVSRLDLGVYHKMLRGAVAFGEDFEQNFMSQIFNLQMGMTQAVSHFSRYEDAKVVTIDGRYNYQGERRVTAAHKIRWFYRLAIIALCTLGIILFLMTANFGHVT